jgi:hypothetical protein
MLKKDPFCFVCNKPDPPFIYFFDAVGFEKKISYCSTSCLCKYLKEKVDENRIEAKALRG